MTAAGISTCARCAGVMDDGWTANGDTRPDEGDIGVCMNCGALHCRHAGRWRGITPVEYANLTPAERARIERSSRWLGLRGGHA